MADGDAAAAIGLAILTGIEKVKDMWKQINATRDMIANHITSGAHTASQITSGTLDEARLPHTWTSGLGVAALGIGTTGQGFDASGNVFAAGATIGSAASIGGRIVNPYGRANAVGSYVLAGFDPSGNLGVTTSSKRFKKNIKRFSPDLQAVMAMQLVEYDRRDGSGHEVGLIAEQLHELGLNWLLFFDDDGRPLGIHYERIASTLLAALQDHEQRLAKLEGQTNA